MSRNSLPDVSGCPSATPVHTDLLAGLKGVCLECVRAPPRGVGRTWPAGLRGEVSLWLQMAASQSSQKTVAGRGIEYQLSFHRRESRPG